VPELRPITAATEPLVDSPAEFTFAVCGESRPTLPRMPFSAVTVRIMRELELLRPAFVLFTGDSVWGYQSSRQEFLNELDRFRALADSTGVPLFNAPGNHEMQSEQAAIDILNECGHDLYGSFDVGRYHFVALNTDEWWKEGRVADEQLDWLRKDLAAHADSDGIFVFMHRPLFSWFHWDFNPDDGEVLQELFRTHPVRAVFASHDHFYYEKDHDGVRYITAGGGGAPLYAQPPQGGFAHYVLVGVKPDGVDYNVVEPFRLEVEHVAGNDGLQPVSTLRVANTTDRDLALRNVRFRCPRLSTREQYRLAVDFEDWQRKPAETAARIAEVFDRNDGSVDVRVEVAVPTGTAFFVTVEARESS
jgi:3',5'-cyclic AMP phosphodiesterase CpdA